MLLSGTLHEVCSVLKAELHISKMAFLMSSLCRHFSDFQFSRWYRDKPRCHLTGDELFSRGCLIYVKSDYTV